MRTDFPVPLRAVAEKSFEAQNPDVDVRFTVRSVEETLEEVDQANGGLPFDVWWGAPAEEAERALRDGWVTRWEPVLQTPFVIAFDRDAVAITDAPSDWLDLFHHGWAEQISIPDPGRSREGAAFVTSVIAQSLRAEGDAYVGFEWLERLDRQIGRYEPDVRESLRVMRGEAISLAVVPRAEVEAVRVDWEGRLYYRAPETGSPTMVRVVALAATDASGGSGAAERFAEHVQSAEILTASKLHTHWEPMGIWGEGTLPTGFELDAPWSAYPLSIELAVDSAEAWLEQWSTDVRGRGK